MSSTPTPKPARANADAHRQEEEDDDQEAAEIPEEATPAGRLGDDDGSGDGGIGGGGGSPPAGGSAGSFDPRSFLSDRRVVAGLLLAAALGLAYLYFKQAGGSVSVESVKDDLDDANSENGVEPDRPPQPDIPQDQNDPLKADEAAFGWVFGDMPESESENPMERGEQ